MIKKWYLFNKYLTVHVHACVALVFLILPSFLYSQQSKLQFQSAALDEVFQVIEQQSGRVINYSPELLKQYRFTGEISIVDFNKALKKVLYDSPILYEISDSQILVYEMQPKEYRICGSVIDLEANDPLIAANVIAKGTDMGSQTDFSGFFDFKITATKNQKVEISYLGYESISFMVQDLQTDECPSYQLVIDSDLIGKEILIQDYILDGISQGDEYGGFALDFDQLSKNHSNVEHDILKTAQLLPGISSIDDSATNLQIRGSSADQNLILWEGMPIYNAGHIFGMISAINPFSINGVNIYKGAYDPAYDNRVGGIVDISLTDSIDNIFGGSLGTTLTEVHGNLDIPLVENKMSMVLSGRQSIGGVYNSPALQSYTDKVFQLNIIDDLNTVVGDDFFESDQTLNYNDWNAKVLYKPSDHIKLSLGFYTNQQDFEYSFSLVDDPFITTDQICVYTKALNASIDAQISDTWSSNVSFYDAAYSNEYLHRESEFGEILFAYENLNMISDRSFKITNDFDHSSKWATKIGYEYNTKEVNLSLGDIVIFDPDAILLSNELASFQNIFLSTSYSDKRLKLDAGIRSTFYEDRGRWVSSPRMNIQFTINDHWLLKADGGVYHQFISQLTDFGNNQISADNPLWILNSLGTELSQKANKIAAGFVFHKQGWLLDVDAYYNYTTGLSTISPVFRIIKDDIGFAVGNSDALGIDLLLKKRWSRFNAWVNYSFGRLENTFPDLFENSFFATNDIRHNLTLVTSYKIKDVQFSLNASYHSGLPYSTPELIPNPDPNETELPFLYFLEYPELNANRLRPYMRLDVNINYRPKIKYLGKLRSEISLTMINVLNRQNIASRGYYQVFNDEAFSVDLAGINTTLLDRTPLLLLRLYW